VGCFGKLGLFTQEDTILNEFKPILLEVASHSDERMEIRAQALLALSDWSMLFSDVLKPCDIGDKTVSFSKLVADLMSNSRTAAVCIAAEVAAKLLFSGRVCDSAWLAQLLAIFFDPRMADLMEEDDGDIKEVGSPVRLQQLLTIFFPAYSMKSELGRDALVGSILPLLELIYFQPPKTGQKGKKASKKKVIWPVVKMISYACSMADMGKPTQSDDATVVQADEAGDGADATQRASVATKEVVQCNSTSLLASVQIAEFLAKHGEDITVTTLRALCKLLGASDFDVEQEDLNKLEDLKRNLEELGMLITDATSLRSLSDLNELLSDIQVDDEEEEGAPSEDEDEENAGEEEGKPKTEIDDSDELESEEDELADSDADDDIVAPVSTMNLSNDLVNALKDVNIADDDESGIFGTLEKENNGKRVSKGRKNSSGSASSRRSRLQRLSEISAK
jgi:condensin complex subunit 3